MALAVVAKTNWFALSTIILFVECPHALTAVCVQLNGSVVNFTKCLQFNVVSPNSGAALSLAISCNFFICDENLEVVFPCQDVLHTLLAD